MAGAVRQIGPLLPQWLELRRVACLNGWEAHGPKLPPSREVGQSVAMTLNPDVQSRRYALMEPSGWFVSGVFGWSHGATTPP